MAQAILQDRRTARAAGIVERHECELQDDGRWVVRDVVTGSGRRHIVAGGRCDCPDHVYRGQVCKHMRAVMVEEQALAAYAVNWNARAEQQRQNIQTNSSKGSAGAAYKGQWYTAEQCDQAEQARAASPRCPGCGGRLECQSYYVGGRGMLAFLVCTRDESHRALPA